MLIHYISKKRSATTLSSRIVWRGGSGNVGMINNHLQRRRRRSVSITLRSPPLPFSGVGFGQNHLELFDSHPILHTWRWCSTLHRCMAPHSRASQVNPQILAAARVRALWTALLYAWENAFFGGEKWNRPHATRDCCRTCKILSTILGG